MFSSDTYKFRLIKSTPNDGLQKEENTHTSTYNSCPSLFNCLGYKEINAFQISLFAKTNLYNLFIFYILFLYLFLFIYIISTTTTLVQVYWVFQKI